MNKSYLYSKPSIIGVLESRDEFDSIGSWFDDNTPELLRKKIYESPLDEMIIELVEIFREGNPNYKKLAVLFGFVEIEEGEQEERIIWKLQKIERKDDDLTKVVMHIDAKHLIIKELYLYVNELHFIQKLKERLNINFKNINLQKLNNAFVIIEKECDISIVKDTDAI